MFRGVTTGVPPFSGMRLRRAQHFVHALFSSMWVCVAGARIFKKCRGCGVLYFRGRNNICVVGMDVFCEASAMNG